MDGDALGNDASNNFGAGPAADASPAGNDGAYGPGINDGAYGPGINDGAFGKGLDGGLIGTEFGGKSAPGNPDGVGLGGTTEGNYSFSKSFTQNFSAKGFAGSALLGGSAGAAAYAARGAVGMVADAIASGWASFTEGFSASGGSPASTSNDAGYSGEGGDRTGLGSAPMGWTTPSAAPLRGAAMASPAEVLMAHAKPKAPYEIKVTTPASSGSDTGAATLAALAVAGIALL